MTASRQRISAYEAPDPGDLAWCRFPEDGRLQPAHKFRPVLVMAVGHRDDEPALPMVRVAPGTSRRTGPGQIFPWEFMIERDESGPFQVSGLSYPTKFDLRHTLELPFTSRFFAPPPRRPFGNTPKLGALHASYVVALRMAASKVG